MNFGKIDTIHIMVSNLSAYFGPQFLSDVFTSYYSDSTSSSIGSSRPTTLSNKTTTSSSKNTEDGLVLEVIHERKIVLSPKAEHKRSQLWIMTSAGNLVPFTPSKRTRDGRRSSGSMSGGAGGPKLVLDIEVRTLFSVIREVKQNLLSRFSP